MRAVTVGQVMTVDHADATWALMSAHFMPNGHRNEMHGSKECDELKRYGRNASRTSSLGSEPQDKVSMRESFVLFPSPWETSRNLSQSVMELEALLQEHSCRARKEHPVRAQPSREGCQTGRADVQELRNRTVRSIRSCT